MKDKSLTPKEQKFLKSFSWLKQTKGKNPSLSEVAKILGYRSINSVYQFISSLHKKGINPFTFEAKAAQDLEIETVFNVPILGIVPCGTPFLAQENWEGQLPVETSLLKGNPKDYFFLKAKGKSMNLAGIDDGDYVLFHSQPVAGPGDKVVALLGDEATIKIFKPGNGYVVLIPKSSNPSYKPIIVSDNIQIQGVVRSVVKKESLEG